MDSKKVSQKDNVANQKTITTLLDDVVTIEALYAEWPNLFTKPQLSWIIKSRYKNGLQTLGGVLKVGRKLYIKKSIFYEWFLSQGGGE